MACSISLLLGDFDSKCIRFHGELNNYALIDGMLVNYRLSRVSQTHMKLNDRGLKQLNFHQVDHALFFPLRNGVLSSSIVSRTSGR